MFYLICLARLTLLASGLNLKFVQIERGHSPGLITKGVKVDNLHNDTLHGQVWYTN